jgi:hypothetical protein
MATLVDNEFTAFNLTDEEFLEGSLLTDLQKKIFMNLRALAAQELLYLELDPLNQLKFAQAHADLSGRIKQISYILDCCKEAEQKLGHVTL